MFSRSVVSDSLQSHGLQHTRLPCPSPSPRVCPSSCPLNHAHCILESYIPLNWGLGCSSGTGVRVSPGAEILPLPPGSHLAQSWLLHFLPSQKVPEEAFPQSLLCHACSPRRVSSEGAHFFPKETISGKCPRIYLLYIFSSQNSS